MTIRKNTWFLRVLYPNNYWLRLVIGYVVSCVLSILLCRVLAPMLDHKGPAMDGILSGLFAGITSVFVYLAYVSRTPKKYSPTQIKWYMRSVAMATRNMTVRRTVLGDETTDEAIDYFVGDFIKIYCPELVEDI